MGSGNYSHAAHEALLRGRVNLPIQQVFQQSKCHPLMDPKGVRLRESRDGKGHPKSMGIVFALDVTGSMGDIPKILATEQLPVFMKILLECKLSDPQLLFMAVGDAVSDAAPLQVGQFESTAKLMDQWLTYSFLEGGGGTVGEESYELGLYFLATHTEMDCMVKRKKRGYIFMTGDEVPYPSLSMHIVEAIIGDQLDEDLPCEEIIAEVQKSYVPFFIIPDHERARHCERRWRDLLGNHVLILDDIKDICYVAAGAILLSEGLVSDKEEMEKRLKQTGVSPDRMNAVIRSLTPFASTLSIWADRPRFFSRLFKKPY
jgi:hypothetical protein